MNLTAGSRLGPYEIVSRIGAGGMGEVWRARDTRLERHVAIKVLSAQLVFARELDTRLASAPPEVRRSMAARHTRLAEAQPPAGADAGIARDAVKQAFVRAFRVDVLVAAGLAAMSALGAIGISSRDKA